MNPGDAMSQTVAPHGPTPFPVPPADGAATEEQKDEAIRLAKQQGIPFAEALERVCKPQRYSRHYQREQRLDRRTEFLLMDGKLTPRLRDEAVAYAQRHQVSFAQALDCLFHGD